MNKEEIKEQELLSMLEPYMLELYGRAHVARLENNKEESDILIQKGNFVRFGINQLKKCIDVRPK